MRGKISLLASGNVFLTFRAVLRPHDVDKAVAYRVYAGTIGIEWISDRIEDYVRTHIRQDPDEHPLMRSQESCRSETDNNES